MKRLLAIVVALTFAVPCLAQTAQPPKPGPEHWEGRDDMTPATIRALLLFALVAVDHQTAAGPQDVFDYPEFTKAVLKGDKELVARLLASGANVDVRDRVGWTPLLHAINDGNREMVELLLASGADVQVRRNQGVSTLHAAVQGGHTEIAALLLARGVDVNVADNRANAPLHIAAARGNTKIVALLLAKGANVNAKTNMTGFEGETDDYVGDTPLHLAALHERDWRALTPEKQMKWASVGEGGFVETAALLLANGTDVNAKNDKGKTPLRLATSKEMKALLREHGAR